MKIKTPLWKVTITEMDRFRGPEVLDTTVYDDEREALAAVNEVNDRIDGSLPPPECYIYAEMKKV
jgi:hypothetical protein